MASHRTLRCVSSWNDFHHAWNSFMHRLHHELAPNMHGLLSLHTLTATMRCLSLCIEFLVAWRASWIGFHHAWTLILESIVLDLLTAAMHSPFSCIYFHALAHCIVIYLQSLLSSTFYQSITSTVIYVVLESFACKAACSFCMHAPIMDSRHHYYLPSYTVPWASAIQRFQGKGRTPHPRSNFGFWAEN